MGDTADHIYNLQSVKYCSPTELQFRAK